MAETTLTVTTKQAPDKSQEWTAEQRETAFEVYMTSAGRDMKTLAGILASELYELPIPYSTLTYWRRTDEWDIKADQRITDFAPMIRDRAVAIIVGSLPDGASYVAGVQAGTVKPDRGRTEATKLAFEVVGMAGNRVSANTPAFAATQVIPANVDTLRNLSPDELMEREQQARTRSRKP